MKECCEPKTIEEKLVDNIIDPNLINAWGIIVDNGYIWVNANNTDLLIRYDLSGRNPYDISFYDESGNLLSNTSSPVVNPTGIVKNPTNGYLLTDGTTIQKSSYLIASESGDLFGYSPNVGGGNKAYRIFAGSTLTPTPVYKGLAVVNNHLFAADFLNGNIDMFLDVHGTNNILFTKHITQYDVVTDPNHVAPFNIVHLHNHLYVMYAYKNTAASRDDNGDGGFIDLYKAKGTFIKRFSSSDDLKSPWAFVLAPKSYCCERPSFLVGNFGSGSILILNQHGHHVGDVYGNNSDTLLVIDGLWGLFVSDWKIYFAAGPDGEGAGLVGFLRFKPNEICNCNPYDTDSDSDSD